MTLVRVNVSKRYPGNVGHCKDQGFLFSFGVDISPFGVITYGLAHVHSADECKSFSFVLVSCIGIYGVGNNRHFLNE